MKKKVDSKAVVPTVVEPSPKVITPETIACSLTRDYDEIQNLASDLVRRVLRFGASFCLAEILLEQRGLLSNRKQGQGLAAWLAQECPTVNYKTAMRWKSLANDAAASLGCSRVDALLMLAGEVKSCSPGLSVSSIQSRIDEMFQAKSLRQLSQQLFDFASEDHSVGRPAGGSLVPAEKLSAIDSALRLWSKPMAFFVRSRDALYKSAALLPADEANRVKLELTALLQVINKRIKEVGQ